MKSHLALAFLIALGCTLPVYGETAPTPPAADTTRSAAPWVGAQAVLAATSDDVQNGGIRGVRPHLDDLEQALAQAPQAFAAAAAGDADATYALADNQSDTLIALMSAAIADQKDPGAQKRKTVAVHNPYPAIALYLGTYYNELDQPADALRVFEAEKNLPAPFRGLFVEAAPIAGERAVALVKLGRFADALVVYDEGVKLSDKDNRQLARMHRGRGYVLTELGRLDEAEQAYQESLTLEPDNALAKRELQYITGLRAGAKSAPSQTITVTPPPPAPQDKPADAPPAATGT